MHSSNISVMSEPCLLPQAGDKGVFLAISGASHSSVAGGIEASQIPHNNN